MTIVFLAFFRNFAKLGGTEGISSIEIAPALKTDINNFLVRSPNKIWFTTLDNTVAQPKDTIAANKNNYRIIRKPVITFQTTIVWLPKLFIESNRLINGLSLIQWTGVMASGTVEMIIGYQEALMMQREGLFKKVGDTITNFFGLSKVKIVWILSPTNTLLDEVHIINSVWFNALATTSSLVFEETPFDGADLFYSYDQNTVPLKLKNLINIKKPVYTLDGKKYNAIYLGYDVAQEMKAAGEFSQIYDTIAEDGKDFIIAWIAKKTYTLLDMMHFIPKELGIEQ